MNDVLIVWGGLALHDPEECSMIVADMLREDGLTVDVTADYGAFAEPDLHQRKLVIPNITGTEIARDGRDNLVAAVRKGTGLGGHHGALATSFQADHTFHYMTGVQWVQHPGNVRDYTVEVTKPEDPIMAGIAASFPYHSEQYYVLWDPTVEVLATTTFDGIPDPVVKGVTVPVVFKRMFEQGRVFYSSLGHQAHEFQHEGMRTILRRGLLWAAGGKA
jgi:type 1 glutamine amidotransferase